MRMVYYEKSSLSASLQRQTKPLSFLLWRFHCPRRDGILSGGPTFRAFSYVLTVNWLPGTSGSFVITLCFISIQVQSLEGLVH